MIGVVVALGPIFLGVLGWTRLAMSPSISAHGSRAAHQPAARRGRGENPSAQDPRRDLLCEAGRVFSVGH